LIKAAVWPLDDDVTPDDIHKHLEMLAERNLILRYDAGRQRLIQVTNWIEHQTINRPKPSKLPPP
jgi:hypothetical protein